MLSAAALTMTPESTAQQTRVLTCNSIFRPDVTAARLAEYFGATHVAAAEIALGEGQTELGTVLFPGSSADRVEILWNEQERQQKPRAVFIRGEKSRWRTRSGLTLGLSLRTVESLNIRPFRILGFGWDYDGAVVSWSGGRLDARSSNCRERVRLLPDEATFGDPVRSRLYSQVQGDREFSSGHPAMQGLNPRVYELWLEYPE